MSTHVNSIPFPCLDSMMMIDWLPKLGEKAFMAWLRLHSWKEPSAASSSVVLPLSINRIIKRLKVGNSTFYDQILRPLWNYGLIDLKKADPHKKEQHLVLHTYPSNDPSKSSAPLLQIRDFDLDPPKENSPRQAEDRDHQEISALETSQKEQTVEPTSTTASPSVIQEDPSPYLIPSDSQPSLPYSIRKEIEENPEWKARAQSIQLVYTRCKDHPHFNEVEFLQKVHTCIRYPHDPNRFAPYLQKSLFNEWNKRHVVKPNQNTHQSSPTTSQPSSPMMYPNQKKEAFTHINHDVPEWVRRQQENPPTDTTNDLNPEQQAIINQLLKDLGEV